MTLAFKAATACHWFGVAYAAGDTIDTTGYDANALRRLLAKAPVYVADSGGSVQSRESVTFADQVLPTGVNTRLPWAKQLGDDLIDLTDPTNPTIITAGVYAVTVNIQTASVAGSPSDLYVDLYLDADGDAAQSQIDAPISPFGPWLTVSVTYYVPAGGTIHLEVQQGTGADIHVLAYGTIQRLS